MSVYTQTYIPGNYIPRVPRDDDGNLIPQNYGDPIYSQGGRGDPSVLIGRVGMTPNVSGSVRGGNLSVSFNDDPAYQISQQIPTPQPIAPVIQPSNPIGEASLGVIVYGPDGRAYGSPAEARNAGVSNPTMSPPAPSNPIGEASVTSGPDGRAYGSPAEARNAGVSNPTMSPPVGVPAIPYGRAATPLKPALSPSDFEGSLLGPDLFESRIQSAPQTIAPVIQPYTPAPLPSIPTQSSGGRNRYAEIMANYAQSQPFSFTSMPSSYTGGFTPYLRAVTPQPALPIEGTTSATIGGGGGGGRGISPDQGGTFSEPTSQQAYDVSMLGRNLGYISPITGLLTSAYGNYLARQVNPNYSNEGRTSVAPIGVGAAPSDGGAPPSGGGAPAPAPSPIGVGAAPSDGGAPPSGGGGGGGRGASNSNPGDPGRGGGGAHLAKGGYVSMQHLLGPNPDGPDDGYAALKDGEYVINDKAVKKYGIELMNAINSGKISKGKLRGLLEM